MAFHFISSTHCWCHLDYPLPLTPLHTPPAPVHIYTISLISLSHFFIMPAPPRLLILALPSISSSPFWSSLTFSRCHTEDRCCIYHIYDKLPASSHSLIWFVRQKKEALTRNTNTSASPRLSWMFQSSPLYNSVIFYAEDFLWVGKKKKRHPGIFVSLCSHSSERRKTHSESSASLCHRAITKQHIHKNQHSSTTSQSWLM